VNDCVVYIYNCRYIIRPADLDNLSLAEFAVLYENARPPAPQFADMVDIDEDVVPVMEQAQGRSDLIILQNNNGTRMKRRSRPAILRSVYFNMETDREQFCYGQLLLHLPFRDESNDLIPPCTNAQTALIEKSDFLRPLSNDGTNAVNFAEQQRILQRFLAQAVLLHEDAAVAPDALAGAAAAADDIMNEEEVLDIQEPVNQPLNVDEMRMTDTEFNRQVSSLNSLQTSYFDMIKVQMRKEDDYRTSAMAFCPAIRLFITGGAGNDNISQSIENYM